MRLVLRLFTSPPTAVRVQFEHKSVPIQIELLLSDTREPLGSAHKAPAKPFMLQSDVERMEQVRKKATLAADREAARLLVRLEGIEMSGEDSPRSKLKAVVTFSTAAAAASSKVSSADISKAAPPSKRRLPGGGATFRAGGAATQRVTINADRLSKLESRLAERLHSRAGEMESRAEQACARDPTHGAPLIAWHQSPAPSRTSPREPARPTVPMAAPWCEAKERPLGRHGTRSTGT